MMAEQFNFNISLSVLNHLGRNLYRNFITVLGEAISNSWDAEAENIWIEIDDDSYYFSIKDDGIGMSGDDFQDKFLKIGYSKRKTGESLSPNKKRPYIGRKGVGKLALLSCAQRIHIMSKTRDTDYVGGIIDNRELDKKIQDDSNPEDCPLEQLNEGIFEDLQRGHNHGTIIYFQNINEGINNNIETLRKLIALHFRFSLIDPSFSIFLNGEKIDFNTLKDLSDNTEFLWTINDFLDPFLDTLNLKERLDISVENKDIKGFIASVEKPKNLNIFGTGEKTGIDVFVNGRLRETNILKHTPAFATRHIASYIYGQIHLDILDDENNDDNNDKFTTSREGIKPEDAMYKSFLAIIIREIFNSLSTQWDSWRTKYKEDGDIDEGNIPKHQKRMNEGRAYREKEFIKQIKDSPNLDDNAKNSLIETTRELSRNNTPVYQDLFILENLLRKFLEIRGINNKEDLNRKFPDDPQIQGEKGCIAKIKEIKYRRKQDEASGHDLKGKFVKEEHDFNYLEMVWLGILVDKVNGIQSGLHEPRRMEDYAKNIRPVRNAVMHTNEVTQEITESEKIADIINIIDELCSKSPNP